MRHYLGLNEFQLRQRKIVEAMYYEPEKLTTSHLLLCGASGTGKSFQSKRLLQAAAEAGLEVDVFDVHAELAFPGAVEVMYSRATGYGHNPLALDTDIHTGGVQRQVDFIVGLIKSVTPQFGAKQEAALRNLLVDTYAASGIFENDSRTWHRQHITEQLRTQITDARKWSELRKYYPTLEDLRSFARRKVIGLTIGADNKAAASYDTLARVQSRLNNAQKRFGKAVDDAEIARLQEQIDTLKQEAIDAFTKHINSIETGKEVEDRIKYDSVEVLTSVLQRIDILNAAGIFRPNEPPFGDARQRVHQIKSLTEEQQILFVKLRLQAIFERWKRVGPTESGTTLRHAIFLDEGSRYFTDDPSDIINVIAKEARKFGIGLWCAAQAPTAFPEDFLTNCGATILLGIHSTYWKKSASMLRVTEDSLRFIRPKEVLSIKLQHEGRADPPFINVAVPNPNSADGRTALEVQAKEQGRSGGGATLIASRPPAVESTVRGVESDDGLADEILLD
ncbi:ATP-binding protein [Ralstonia sp. ASV6]|uniref:ATP-binding protein n=1 Tax=Ralstonia sp. ASV6 TaxID=2795124 RepID=UPI0018EC283C|nr:DUF87 domain-containing protein [Ralstonia sp. ASV6]